MPWTLIVLELAIVALLSGLASRLPRGGQRSASASLDSPRELDSVIAGRQACALEVEAELEEIVAEDAAAERAPD